MLAIERRGRVLVAALPCAPVDPIDAALPARLDARMMDAGAGASAVVDGELQACVDALPPHPRRRGFLAVAALPRTAIGTLLCRKLQDLQRTLNARQQASSVESMERQAIESG